MEPRPLHPVTTIPFVRIPDFDDRAARVLCRGFCAAAQVEDILEQARVACTKDALAGEDCVACVYYAKVIQSVQRIRHDLNDRINTVFGRQFRHDCFDTDTSDLAGMVDFLRLAWVSHHQPRQVKPLSQ